MDLLPSMYILHKRTTVQEKPSALLEDEDDLRRTP